MRNPKFPEHGQGERLSGRYVLPVEHESKEADEKAAKEADQTRKLDERQALTAQRNLHNFAQLETADFPGTVTLEFNKWVDSKIIGAFASRCMRKQVRKTHHDTRIIRMHTDKGYFIPAKQEIKETGEKKDSDTGFALTTEGLVYRVAHWSKDRNCAEIDETGLIPNRRAYKNVGHNLADYEGENKAISPVDAPYEFNTYASRVGGSESFSWAFNRFTRRVLADARLSYTFFPADAPKNVGLPYIVEEF